MLDVIVYFLKKAVECCMVSKKRMVIITLLTFLISVLVGTFEGIYSIIIIAIYVILYNSYGMQFTKEVIDGGQSLPKFDFRSIPLGIKATIIFFCLWGYSNSVFVCHFSIIQFSKF